MRSSEVGKLDVSFHCTLGVVSASAGAAIPAPAAAAPKPTMNCRRPAAMRMLPSSRLCGADAPVRLPNLFRLYHFYGLNCGDTAVAERNLADVAEMRFV